MVKNNKANKNNDNGVDKINKILKAKIFAKARYLKQSTFLSSKANNIFFIKKIFNWYFLAIIKILSKKSII